MIRSAARVLRFRYFALAALIAMATFLADLIVPLGFAGAVPYVFAVLIASRGHRQKDVWLIAMAAAILTFAGYCLSPSIYPETFATANRALALVMIVVTAQFGICLQRREKRLRGAIQHERDRFFDQSLDLLFVAGIDGTVHRANPSLAKMLGYSEEELIRIPFMQHVYAEDVEAACDAVYRVSRGEEIARFRSRLVTRDGEVRWIEWRAPAVLPENDVFYASGRDVTEQIEQANEVQRWQEFLEGTIDSLTSHLCILDESGRIVLANRAWREFAEANGSNDEHAYVGRNYLGTCDVCAVEGVPEAREISIGVRELLQGHRDSLVLEYPCHSQDEQRWFCCRATSFAHGQQRWVTVVHENVTDRRRAHEQEALLTELIENTTDLVGVAGVDRRPRFLNRAGRRQLGMGNDDDLSLFKVADFHPAWVVDLLEQVAIPTAIEDGTWSGEAAVLTSDGTEVPVWTVIVAHRDNSGNVQYLSNVSRDLTQMRRFHQTNQKLASIVKSSPDAILSKTLDGTIMSWNDAAEKIYGYTAEEMIGNSIRLIVPEDQHDEVDTILETVLSGQDISCLETVRRRKNGRLINVSVSIAPIRDEHGHVVGASAVAHDITERLAIACQLSDQEKSLQKAKQQLRSVLDSTAEAILGLGLDGRCTFANASCLSMLGYHEETELLGEQVESLIGSAQPGAASGRPEAFSAKSERRQLRRQVEEKTIQRRDGTTFLIECWSHPVYEADAVTGAVVTFFDISERAKARQKLRDSEAKSLYAAVAYAAQTDCFDDALEKCVRSICNLIGWPIGHAYVPSDSGDVLEPTKIWHVDDGLDAEPFKKISGSTTFVRGVGLPGRIWQTGEPHWVRNLPFANSCSGETASNDSGTCSAFGFPIKVKGTVVAVLEFFSQTPAEPNEAILFAAASIGEQVGGVLERQRVTAELREAKDAAEKATVAKSEFLSSMSHELRTPLNGVIGMTELLGGTGLTEKQRRYVDACRNSGQSLLQLINDVLDFSKIEAGRMELDSHEFDLEEIVEDTVERMSWCAAEKGLEMPCFTDRMSGMVVKGDSCRVGQVLVNLISNAIKFTDSGEVTVESRIVEREEGQVTVRFSVADSGIGIPPDKLSRLFHSFSQVDAGTTRQFGGTGLGLAISQKLIHLMGGTIDVASECEVGSRFWFEVPFAVVDAAGQENDSAVKLTGQRALVVDDNETNRTLLSEYLSGWGVEVIGAGSVDEALTCIRVAEAKETPFQLILTDYHMPERTGLELAEALKEREDLIVLLLSSADADMKADELCGRGVDIEIRKPLRRRELKATLRRLLAHKSGTSSVTDQATGATQSVTMPTSFSGMKILLAEDNHINSMYVVELLSQFGCTCDTVTDGRQAVDAVKRSRYDMILMDCQMPEMDGFSATRRIRQLEDEGVLRGCTPIVALTAFAIQGDRERCLEAGMDEYLSKPVQPPQVAEVLTKVLETPQGSLQIDERRSSGADAEEETSAPPIPAEELMQRCFGKLEFADSLLEELEFSGPARLAAIREASGDLSAAADAAHALKGTAGIMCAGRLQDIASAVEQAGRSADASGVRKHLHELTGEMQRCVDYVPRLREELRSLQKTN